MFFGTFQEIPYNENGEACSFSEVNRRSYKNLNFRPIWAFPINNLKDFYFHFITCPANFPQLFVLFNAEEYVRIDRIKHSRDIMNLTQTDDLSSYISDDCDDVHSEFLVDPKIVENNIVCMFNILGVKEFLEGRSFSETVGCGQMDFPNELVQSIRYFAKNNLAFVWNLYEDLDYKSLENLGGYYTREDYQIMRINGEQSKFAFASTLLPIIYYAFSNNGKITNASMFATLHNCKKILYLLNDFGEWGKSDCSLEQYDFLYKKITCYVVDNIEIQKAILENRLPGPNEKCLCGSGFKYKKCCGKYL